MSVQPWPGARAWVDAITAAWRRGDAAAVLAQAARDPAVTMGGPGAAVPVAVGRDAVATMIERVVRPLPEGAGAFVTDALGFTHGDAAWLNADAELRLPGRAPIPWHIWLVLVQEEGAWRFVHFGALAGGPMPAPPPAP